MSQQSPRAAEAGRAVTTHLLGLAKVQRSKKWQRPQADVASVGSSS